MLVVHSIERLDNYMLVGAYIMVVICLITTFVPIVYCVYLTIYQYVSDELDKCTYFGEDYERISKS